MRSRLAKTVRQRFALRISQELPDFVLNQTEVVPSGCVLYERKTPTLTFYILLLLAPKDDRFTIEVGWSEKGKLPTYNWGRPNDPPREGGIMFRMWCLWNTGNEDLWWRFEPEVKLEDIANWVPQPIEAALELVDTQVDDAIQKLLEFGIPYFERVAAEHGHPIKLR